MKHLLRLTLAVLVTTACASVAAAGASAQGRITDTVQCGGETLTILVQPSNAEISWGAVQVVGGGHLIPMRFEFSAYNDTKGMLIFSDRAARGNGAVPAGLAASATTCTQTFTGPLGEFLEPGEDVPPGSELTDTVTVTLSVLLVEKRR
jgi:hypothetical protein